MFALSLTLGCALLTEGDWDPDGDGVRMLQDCDDTDAEIGRLTWFIDLDGDGFGAGAGIEQCEAPDDRYVLVGGDCDDARSEAYPEADELCNGVDDDCDDAVDNDAIPLDWYADEDEDGWGDPDDLIESCDFVDGYTRDVGDCDDADAAVNPEALEVCNEVDDDCDGLTDDDDDSVSDASTWYLDVDGDDYGQDAAALVQCFQPEGYAALGGDCVDSDTAFNPGATESDCTDPNDYNCDGSTGFADADEDGWPACQECDDTDEAVNPDATEVCNGKDDDCNGTTDGGEAIDALTYFLDDDGDLYGREDSTLDACSQPAGYAEVDGDCDDTDGDVNPAASEACDAADVDEDCDGFADDADTGASGKTTFFADSDGDGYGDPDTDDLRCDGSSAWLEDDSDCDDTDAAINPDTVWYGDGDGDGYGDSATTKVQCEQPSGYLSDASDCDDGDGDVNPAADEICLDQVDNDCDGALDGCDPVDAADAGVVGYGVANTTFTDKRFGSHVSTGDIDGDGTDDLLVSDVTLSTVGRNERGGTFLYLGPITSGSTLGAGTQDAVILGDVANINCGKQAAILPDWDSSGEGQLVVGCYEDTGGGSNSGAAYIFDELPSGAMSSEDYSAVVVGDAEDTAGHQVVWVGDLNDDTVDDLGIGATLAGSGKEGAVFLMFGPVSADAYIGGSDMDLTLSGKSSGDKFGNSLARAGDLNGDGSDDLLVGVFAADGGGANAGATAIWLGPLSALVPPDVAIDGEAVGDNLGVLVSGPGDVDGDGYDDALTCASDNDDGGTDAGKCYLFGASGVSGWAIGGELASFTGSGSSDALGDIEASLPVGDWDGDGDDELVLGARDANEGGGSGNGAAYVFLGPVSGSYSVDDANLVLHGTEDDDQFGTSISGMGDQDGDGYPELVIGAREGTNSSGDQTGMAYIFYTAEWF